MELVNIKKPTVMLLFALTAGTFVKEEFFGSKLTIVLL